MPTRYDPAKHDRPLVCPKCTAQNAPANADNYSEQCHDCGFSFETPVNNGDEVTVEITDMHESGRGVGRHETGFIVLVDGVLPTNNDDKVCEVDVKIKRVRDNYAESGEVLDKRVVDVTDEDEEDAEEDDDVQSEQTEDNSSDYPQLGRRDNHWGGN